MHMALFRVRDGSEPLGEAGTGLTSAEIGPSRTLSNAICIFSQDINFLQI